MMLPIPKKNPFITLQEPSEEDFLNPKGEEDEELLKTGEWGNDPNIDESEDDSEDLDKETELK